MKILSKSEGKLLELKAKVEPLDVVREKMRDLKARRVGTFRQIDTMKERTFLDRKAAMYSCLR